MLFQSLSQGSVQETKCVVPKNKQIQCIVMDKQKLVFQLVTHSHGSLHCLSNLLTCGIHFNFIIVIFEVSLVYRHNYHLGKQYCGAQVVKVRQKLYCASWYQKCFLKINE